MATYQMGQYRFANASECMTTVSASASYKDVSFSGAEDDGVANAFKDIMIVPNSSLSAGTAYYLTLSIPKDLNYDMTFIIKLYKNLTDGGSTEVYQRIKQITVNKGGGTGEETNIRDVALYDASLEDNVEDIRAMIPITYVPSSASINGLIYKDNNNNFYLGRGNGANYTRITKVNYLKVAESWKESSSSVTDNIELILTPVESGFDKIVLEMVREAEDYTIQRTTSSGIEYGRIVDIDNFSFNLYQLSNLVAQTNATTLSTIGVSAHPGLLMAINGEEIRVPATGFYELDNVISITDLGIAARSNRDSFIIDYQYQET